jgi:hypothetical protein
VIPAEWADSIVGATVLWFSNIRCLTNSNPKWDPSPEIVLVGDIPLCVAVQQALEFVAVRYACTSPGQIQVAHLADHLPWYLNRCGEKTACTTTKPCNEVGTWLG